MEDACVSAADAARIVAAAGDAAGVVAVIHGACVGAAEAAPRAAAGDTAGVGAVFHGAFVATADAAHIGAAIHRAPVGAAGDGAPGVLAAEDTHIAAVGGDRAVFAHGQVLDLAALAQAAHEAPAVASALETEAVDGVARTVKGAGVGGGLAADGPHVEAAQVDIGGQRRICRGVLYVPVAVDPRRKPEEVACVGDLVDAVFEVGGLVCPTEPAEAFFIVAVLVVFVGVAAVKAIDHAVGVVQHREVIAALAQVLEPDQSTLAGGTVEQPGHLAGGKLGGGFYGRTAATIADPDGTGGIQPVAVGDGACVVAADTAHKAAAGDPTGVVTALNVAEISAADTAHSAAVNIATVIAGFDGAAVFAADTARRAAAVNIAAVIAGFDGAAVVAADTARIAAAGGDGAVVGAAGEGAAVVSAADAARIAAAAGDRAAVGAVGDGAAVVLAADAAQIVFHGAGDLGGAVVGAVLDGAAFAVAADAAHIVAVALDIALVGRVLEGAVFVVAADAAHIVAAAGDGAAVGAGLDGAVAAVAADAAHVVAAAGDGAVVGAVLDGAAVDFAADAAHILVAGDRAGFAHGQVLDGAALAQVAHKALVVAVRVVDHHALDGVAVAVKGTGVFEAVACTVIADGGPVAALGDDDVLHQHRLGGGILRIELGIGGVPVDQGGKPEQLPGVGDLVYALPILLGGLVMVAEGAEAILIKVVDGFGEVVVVGIVAGEGLAVAEILGIDHAVGAVQHGESVAALAQGLEPGQVALAGGTVEQEAHLAGGEFRFVFAGGFAAAAADTGGSGALQPVAVGDGAVVGAADAARIAAGDCAGVIAVLEGAVVGAADAAHIVAAGDRAAVGAVGDGAVFAVAADTAHIVAAGDRAGLAHRQVLNDAAFAQGAHKTLVVGGAVDRQVVDGVALAVKDACIGGVLAADGGPVVGSALVAGDGDVVHQHRIGGDFLFHALQGAVDQGRKPEQLSGVGDLVGIPLQSGGLVLAAVFAEAVAVAMVLGIGSRILVAEPVVGAVDVVAVDDAVGAVRHGGVVAVLAQILAPDVIIAGHGVVEQVAHLAGGKIVGGLGYRIVRTGADAFVGGALQPVAVGDRSSVVVVHTDDGALAGAVAFYHAAGVITVCHGNIAAVAIAQDAAQRGFLARARDVALIAAVPDGGGSGVARDAALTVHALRCRERPGVKAPLHHRHSGAALAQGADDAANVVGVGRGHSDVHAADHIGDGAARILGVLHIAGHACHGADVVGCDGDASCQGETFDGALAVAEQAGVAGGVFDGHAADGVALAVKGPGVNDRPVADGGPDVTVGNGDIVHQHRIGALILRRAVGQGAVDQRREPEQVAGVFDLVDAIAVLLRGFVVAFADSADAVLRAMGGFHKFAVAIDAEEPAHAVQLGIDDVVAAVRHWEGVSTLTQILAPDVIIAGHGVVEQVAHRAGGKIVGGLGLRIARTGADALVGGALLPVAVGDGGAAFAADAARITPSTGGGADHAGIEATLDRAAVAIAQDAACPGHKSTRNVDIAGVGAVLDGAAVVVAADAACKRCRRRDGDGAAVDAVLDGAAVLAADTACVQLPDTSGADSSNTAALAQGQVLDGAAQFAHKACVCVACAVRRQLQHQVVDGVALAVKGAAVCCDGRPGRAAQIDVVLQGGPGAVVAVIDRLRKPEQFRRIGDAVRIAAFAIAGGLAGSDLQRRAPAQHHRHGKAGRLFAQGITLGQGSRKGVFAGGGRLWEVPAGPSEGQLHRIGTAVYRGGDAGGQHRNHRVKVHGGGRADAG